MIKFVFCVFDSKARVYAAPFLAPRREVAVRDFTRAARDPQLDIYRFPEDYSLYELGTFDDETAALSLHLQPEAVVTAIQCQE